MVPVDSLLFEAAKKAFCHSIIKTIASAAHTAHKAVYFQKPPVLPAGILRPADALLNVKLQFVRY